MRNKASLIPVALIALVGVVFASGMYFPDSNPSLPREPKWPGTIGGALYSLFAPDGTAKNTEKLWGITATGYLRNNNCTDSINKKWVWVAPDGKGICGAGTPVFAAIWKFNSITPGVQVMKNGSSTWTPANTTDTLYPGDLISTNGGTATIDFALDDSLLRLDTGTTLELRLGNLDGNSVAEAILSDGRLWGRILTSTGVNLGGGGIVAWVRWTSVSVEKSGSSYKMSIIDSQKPANAASLSNRVQSSENNKTIGSRIISDPATNLVAFTQVISNNITGSSPTPYKTSSTKEMMIASSPWIRDNTKLDIDYLYTNSGTADIIRTEYSATIPSDTTASVLSALCGTEGTVANQGSTYWKSLIGTTYTDKCRSSQLVAFGEYGNWNLSLYFSGMVVTASGGSTNNITLPGKYLAYNMNNLPWYNLQGKTIRIAYTGDPVNDSNIFYGGNGMDVSRSGTTWSGGTYIEMLPWEGNNIVTFRLKSSPSLFLIWNNTVYSEPIGVTITKITIN
jgi:hypothetical protein